MKLYNTLTKQLETFTPKNNDMVTMYTCGPTVYHYAHIGNLRAYIFEDVLEKGLNYIGYNVKRCMNITDVGHMTSDSDDGDDKMLKGAKRENKTVYEIAEYYTNQFYSDINKLNIKKPEIIKPASKEIEIYIKIIEKLLEQGYAYKSNNNIYFDIKKAKDYYKLSGIKEEDLKIAVREDVKEDTNKKNSSDFGLWFTSSKFENQDMKWESPFGFGYPGWHIECTGIAIKYLGEYLDIHCGGIDNIFPHHTNEIAQSEAYLGHKWCEFWIHGEHLSDKTGKMSKSKGDFLTLKILEEKGFDPIIYRMFCLLSHYRNNLVFTYENLTQVQNQYNKLKNKINLLEEDDVIDEYIIEIYLNKFKEAIKNDLNTSLMITYIYDILKEETSNSTKLKVIKSYNQVLSLNLFKQTKVSADLHHHIMEQINLRNNYKNTKEYKKADEIREKLLKENIIIKDTKEGTIYEVK